MGDLISLAQRRAAHPGPAAGPAAAGPRAARVTFFFDLCSPWTYLAAERADRVFPGVRWRPATGRALAGPAPDGRAGPAPQAADAGAVRAAVERRAIELGMPLVWPDRWPDMGGGAMRVAALAADLGVAPAFVLAATRLAFCGGYDLEDPEIIAEAAAAAGLGLDEALAAGGERRRDVGMRRTALGLARRGARELPVVVVDRLLFAGERRLAEAAAAAAAPPDARRRRSARPT
jgi:2-hydroxychromene-2-carboxylate isomerase